jgi:hypothetical protein
LTKFNISLDIVAVPVPDIVVVILFLVVVVGLAFGLGDWMEDTTRRGIAPPRGMVLMIPTDSEKEEEDDDDGNQE